MLKEILKLKGAQKLTSNEQKSINGGDTGVACGAPAPICGPSQTRQCINGQWVCVSACPWC